MTDSDTRQVLPEVKTYLEAYEAAEAAYGKTMEEIRAKYPLRRDYNTNEGREQRQAYNKADNEAYETHVKARNEAWEALKASADPLVKWIAENAGAYRSEAGRVLKALPATLEELDTLAEEQDWCGTWTGFRDQAIEAGVMPGYVPPSPAFEAVLTGIDAEACCTLSTRSKRRISTLLAALVAEAKGEEVQAA